MRIINIVGHSNTGKTTLIIHLVPALSALGRVATIKQLGCHSFNLPKGKDTTLHFEAGAECSTGVDSEKAVIAVRGGNLFSILDYYHWLGMEYVVVEGFKEFHFPCAVIGDYETEHAVMHNPTVEDILSNLQLFPEYVPNRI